MGGFSLAYGVGDGGYRNLGLQFGVIVTRRERNLRTRRPDNRRDHHGGRRRVCQLRSFLKQERRAVGEVKNDSSGRIIYEGSSTRTGIIKGARVRETGWLSSADANSWQMGESELSVI